MTRGPSSQLPEILLESDDLRVVHGVDPGRYYCEHMFFATQRVALEGAGVAKNADGEVLVGFLHVPEDGFVRVLREDASYTQAERHARTRHVVGAALSGIIRTAAVAVPEGPLRVMLNGYDRFRDVCNNPTGEFVDEVENLDSALAIAFGTGGIHRERDAMRLDDDPPGARVHRYLLGPRALAEPRSLLVRTQRFPVTDAAIDGKSATSVQRAIARFAPHAVLSLGVCGPGPYLAEHNAGDGGLLERDGGFAHVDERPPTFALPPNFALARAILVGAAHVSRS